MEDMQKVGKDQFAAISASTSAWAKAVQGIATEATDYSKKSFEASRGMFEKLVGAKSLDKVIEVQQEFAKTAFESLTAQATKMGELYSKLIKDAFKIEGAKEAAKGEALAP